MKQYRSREETMSAYVAQEDEKRIKLAELLRRRRAEAVDNDMLARLRKQQRVARIDKQLSELAEMRDSTSHPKLKAMLSGALVKLNNAREAINTC
jgi:hypothetical protein